MIPFGSSPLVRGKHFKLLLLISRQLDHPRLCGANVFARLVQIVRAGSSPLVRGKQDFVSHEVIVGRIIPACAGQTPEHAPRAFRDPDHPRLCGANHAHVAGALRSLGSSPLVRGKPMTCSLLLRKLRIIPACAEQTYCSTNSKAAYPDHPRCAGQTGLSPVAHTRAPDHPRLCGANIPHMSDMVR